MAITRKVDTDVYCDICGKWVMQIMSSERKKGYISQMDRNCNGC